MERGIRIVSNNTEKLREHIMAEVSLGVCDCAWRDEICGNGASQRPRPWPSGGTLAYMWRSRVDYWEYLQTPMTVVLFWYFVRQNRTGSELNNLQSGVTIDLKWTAVKLSPHQTLFRKASLSTIYLASVFLIASLFLIFLFNILCIHIKLQIKLNIN